MPITAAKGQINLVLESLTNQGMYMLMNNVVALASMSVTNQPLTSPASGMRLVVWIFNSPPGGGTITIAGKDPAGNSISEGPITVPAATVAAQNATVGKWEYETANIFGSVSASGVTTTGLAGSGATITIQGVQAGKFLIPGVLKTHKKFDRHSPNEHRNLLDMDTHNLQTINKVSIDELSQDLYPENSLWVAYMVTGSVPTITTLPATPTSLLTATAVASTMTLTTQPAGTGQVLILTVAGSSATGTITLTGNNQYGVAGITETITCAQGGTNGNGTYYSANVYNALTGGGQFTTTGLTGGTVRVQGVYGWQYVFLPQDQIYSACLEKYTGVDSFSLPWSFIEEADFDFDMLKEFKLTTKGQAQDRIVIGDRTATSLSANRVTAIGQPGDIPMVSWSGLCYIDTAVASVPTTTFGDIMNGKIVLKSPQVPNWTMTNSQNFSRVNRKKRETTFSAKLDLTNVLQLEQYRQNLIQYITFAFYGQAMSGSNVKTWQFTFPVRWEDFDIVSTPDMERVEATVAARAEYDAGLGGAYKLTVICQQPPTFPN